MRLNLFLKITIVALVLAYPAYLLAQSFSVHEYVKGEPKDLKLSSSCKGCHPEIYAEWESTLHARASYTKDSLHNAMKIAFEGAMKQKGAPESYFCAHCHTPMAFNQLEIIIGQMRPDDNDPRIQEGIGCNFCHSIVSVHDGMPSPYYELQADGSVQGPGNATKTTPVHEIHKNEIFKTVDVCGGCHGFLMNDLGVQICSLREEEWDGKSDCQKCHMVEVDGKPSMMSERTKHHSHKMTGGHDIEMLKKSADMNLSLSKAGDVIIANILITNKSAHRLPSTMPLRMAVLKVTALDADGKVVWENFKQDPMKEDSKAVFVKLFAKGDTVGVPIWEAERTAMDSRIPSGGTSTLTYQIDGKDVKKINAVLLYFPVMPPAIEKFGLEPDGFIKVPHPIVSVSTDI
jgi:hypothetical protein